MNFLQAVILGLVQGLTEFIPVSSTGHLILAREIMGLNLIGTLSFDAILQLATGFAVLIYFWRDLWNMIKNRDYKLFLLLVIATIPAIVFGLFLENYMETVFRGTRVVAITLIMGSILFYFAEKKFSETIQIFRSSDIFSQTQKPDHKNLNVTENLSSISVKKSFTIGLFQCLSLIPGMSRSGSTISGGFFLGLSREVTIRFSFLLSLPIIFGSGLKKLFDLIQINQGGTLIDLGGGLIIASFFSFISGLLAIHFLLKFLKNHSLNWFGAYRIILAIIILIWL